MPDKQKRLLYVAGIAVALSLAVWFLFPGASPTQQIEKILNRAAKAVEAKSIIRLNNFFTMGYSHNGTIERAAVMEYAQQFFNETDALTVKIVRIIHDDPKLAKNTLTARAMVVLQVDGTLKEGGQKFQGIRGGAETFLVTFSRRNSGDAWKIEGSKSLNATDAVSLSKEVDEKK